MRRSAAGRMRPAENPHMCGFPDWRRIGLMPDLAYVPAPRWRETGAGLVDAGVLGGLSWLARRRELIRLDGPFARLMGVVPAVLREQLRTPGQLLLGIRTVDRRTGARVVLWRSFAVAGASIAGRLVIRRLAVSGRSERERPREDFLAEMHELMRQHPQASPEREAARRELFARHPSTITITSRGILRAVAPTLLFGLVMRRLRRRLAPTVEVLARGG